MVMADPSDLGHGKKTNVKLPHIESLRVTLLRAGLSGIGIAEGVERFHTKETSTM